MYAICCLLTVKQESDAAAGVKNLCLPSWPRNCIYSDEVWFTLSGHVNGQYTKNSSCSLSSVILKDRVWCTITDCRIMQRLFSQNNKFQTTYQISFGMHFWSIGDEYEVWAFNAGQRYSPELPVILTVLPPEVFGE